jgi:protein-tyrosine phosphatase
MYNFGPAAPGESTVFGACKPRHGRHAPNDDSVQSWLEFLTQQGIERVCCLLASEDAPEIDALVQASVERFGEDNVCQTPIESFSTIENSLLHETVLPFLAAADHQSSPVVVHCSAGEVRTGQVLVLWLVTHREFTLEEAITAVQRAGRRPLVATTRRDFKALLE